MEQILFRYHRGGYAESMATAVPVESMQGLKALLESQNVTIRPYKPDPRNGWETQIVHCDGAPVGFTSGKFALKSTTPAIR